MSPPFFPRLIRTDAQRAQLTYRRRVREWCSSVTGNLKESIRRRIPLRPVDVLEQGIQLAAERQLTGDYVEFGVFTGRTTIRAYHLMKQFGMHANRRILAFDSFEGIPALESADRVRYQDFQTGSYACSVDEYLRNLARYGVPRDIVTPVPGWFDRTCNRATAERIGLQRAALVFFDSDIFSSTLCSLNFIGDYLEDGAILFFDDWNSHRSHPQLGERGALAQWARQHPEWLLTPVYDTSFGRASFSVHRRVTAAEEAELASG